MLHRGEAAAEQAYHQVVRLRVATGRGPTCANTLISSDLAVVTLADCRTAPEQTEEIRSEAMSTVEAVTGEKVVAYLTAQEYDPDVAIIAFYFRPATVSAEPTTRFDSPGALTVRVEELTSTVLLRMEGEIDLATIHQVMAEVNQVDLDRITLLVIDLDRVTFLDLAGLHAVLRINDECENHGVHLTVIAPRCAANRVFTLTRAHLELDLVDASVSAGQ